MNPDSILIRAEKKRLMGLAHYIHDALSARNRATLTLGEIELLLTKAELLTAALINTDVEIVVNDA